MKNIILLLAMVFILSTDAFAQNFRGLIRHFNGIANEDWNEFELSYSIQADFQTVLMDISQTPGLENLDVTTLIDEEDKAAFMDGLFDTHLAIPLFCYNIKGLEIYAIDGLSTDNVKTSCHQHLETLLAPLFSGDYVLRSFKIKGVDQGDFHTIKLMAEDLKGARSFIIHFDIDHHL